MPIVLSRAGFDMTVNERIGALIEGVGGVTEAARITGKSRGAVHRWRQEGVAVELDAVLPLAVENGVSLDWVATGYQVRKDLLASRDPSEPGKGGGGASPYVRLMPLRPGQNRRSKAEAQLTPSPVGFTAEAISALAPGLTPDHVRYAVAGDDGMAPAIGKGSLVLVDIRPQPLRSGIYLVDIGDELVARRANPMPGGAAALSADAIPGWNYAVSSGSPADLITLGVYRLVWAGQAR
jgi:hypothetical protein